MYNLFDLSFTLVTVLGVVNKDFEKANNVVKSPLDCKYQYINRSERYFDKIGKINNFVDFFPTKKTFFSFILLGPVF